MSPREQRQAAFAGRGLPEALQRYVDKVRAHAYQLSDGEVAALRAAGRSDDELFELTVAAAMGAAEERLQAGLRALAAAVAEAKKGGSRAAS